MHSTSLQCHLNVLSISTHLVSFHFISFSFSFHFISFHSVIHCTPSLKSFHLWHWWHEMISFYTCLFPCSQFMPIPFNETSALPCAGTTVTRRIETWKEFQLHIEFLGMHTRAHTHWQQAACYIMPFLLCFISPWCNLTHYWRFTTVSPTPTFRSKKPQVHWATDKVLGAIRCHLQLPWCIRKDLTKLCTRYPHTACIFVIFFWAQMVLV